jgi:nicotinamidase-related amidase
MAHSRILAAESTALLVIDIQEAFRNAILDFSEMVAKASIAVRGFAMLGRPIIVTEQYPKGLGRTVEEILLSLPDENSILEKTAFSACGAIRFTDRLSSDIKQIVVSGLETHVCVNQTVHHLLERGFQVHILTDAVGSRFEQDRKTGLAKMFASGAVPSSTEMALFEMLRDSKHAQFKQVQSLLR